MRCVKSPPHGLIKQLAWATLVLFIAIVPNAARAAVCGPPEILSPRDGDGEVSCPVEFAWRPVSGADAYTWILFDDNGNRIDQIDGYRNTSLIRYLTPETYRFVVVPEGDCTPVPSAEIRFRVVECCPKAPTLPQPADGTEVPTPVTFRWTVEAGADRGYELHVLDDGGREVFADRLANNIATGVNLPPGDYEWFVESLSTDCSSPNASPHFGFRAFEPVVCPTSAPSLINPVGVNVLSPATFNWSPVPNATQYQFRLYNSGGSQIDTAVVNGTSLSRVLSPAVYGWKVEALAPGCPPLASTFAEFRVEEPVTCPESGPVLNTPSDVSTVFSPVSFSWGSVPSATSYRLLVYLGETQVIQQTTGGTSLILGLDPGSYEWWVEALSPGCPAKLSAKRRFKVDIEATCPTIGPALKTPGHRTEVDSPVRFTWTTVSGAESYVIQVFDDSGRLRGEEKITGTVFDTPLEPGKYRWVVLALAPDCNPISSPFFEFAVIDPSSSCPSHPPTLFGPAMGERVGSPVRFAWSSVTGAAEYRFLLFLNDREVKNQTLTGTTLSLTLEPAEYVWFVEALGRDCQPVVSPRSFFIVPSDGLGCPTVPPRILTPVRGAEVGSPVLLSWSAVSGATGYRVLVFTRGELVLEKEVTGASLSLNLDSGEYDWFVESIAPGCIPVASERFFFFVSCALGAPGLVSPADGATVPSPVQFLWNGAAGAEFYVIQIFFNGNVYIEEKVGGTSATFSLRPGVYRWAVAANFDVCPPEMSEGANFTVSEETPCPAQGPVLEHPADGSEVNASEVAFAWDAVAGALGYRLHVFSGEDDLKVVIDTKETTLPLVLKPGPYEWFVLAFVERCEPVRSAVWRFKLPEATNCENGNPALVSPAPGTEVEPPFTFMWNGVSEALAYELFLQREDGAPTIFGRTERTSLTVNELRPGLYRWWVLAIFDRCPPTRSEVSEFAFPVDEDCIGRRPLLLAPANGDRGIPNPVYFEWTVAPGATGYQVFVLDEAGTPTPLAAASEATNLIATVAGQGEVIWFVRAFFATCPPIDSQPSHFGLAPTRTECGVIDPPRISVVGSTTSGGTYRVFWSPVPNADEYELQEADNDAFRNTTSTTTTETQASFSKTVTSETVYFYRVRGTDDCDDVPGPFSRPIGVVIRSPESVDSSDFNLVRELGDDDLVVQEILVDPNDDGEGGGAGVSAVSGRRRGVTRPELSYTTRSNSDWLSVSPSNGTLSSSGAEITVTADPSALPTGTTTGTVTVSTSSNQTTTLPVSVSLVTPVTPTPSGATTSESLIIPVVAHASTSVSNVAVSNISAETRKYRITFRETGTSDTEGSLHAEFQLDPGETSALDDVVASWFGADDDISGVLEIRPLQTTSSSSSTGGTVASSINFTSALHGTLGEHVPAIPISSLVSSSSSSNLLIPNISSGSTSVSSIGFVEGSGEDATVTVSFYDSDNNKVLEESMTLQAGEHTELSDLLSGQSIDGGRAEVSVSSTTGSVLAYARVEDPRTGDSRFVAAQSAEVTDETQIIVGASSFAGEAGSRETDIWLYNPNGSAQTVTMTFYPEGDPSSSETAEVTLEPGEGKLIDGAIGALFGLTDVRGAIHVESLSGVITSATSEMDDGSGTISTILPSISTSSAIGSDDAPLQLLQLQESDAYSSDLGIAEVSGRPATVEVSAAVPGSLSSVSTTVTLQSNEFKQVRSVLRQLGFGDTRNARISVRVVSGEGKVTSYASVVNKASSDETIIPPN